MDKFRIDGSKLQFHPQRVAQWQQADTWEKAKSVYPVYVEITTCGACNHRCTFCAIDYVGYRAIQPRTEVLIERLQEMQRLGVKSVMYAGEGEPLLNKDINRIVAETPMDVAFTTNGVLLNKLDLANVAWVKVSLNAGLASTYSAVHRTDERDFARVWANIKDAVSRKGKCSIGVQSVLLRENRAEMFLLANLAKDAGADYFVIKPYSQHKFAITHQHEGTDYSGDEKLAEALATLNGDGFEVIFRANAMKQEAEDIHYHKCSATPFFWSYISANGDVYACSAFLLDERFKLGNIHKQSFQEIWEGERRQKNYELMTGGFDIGECRKNCRMNASNIFLSQLDRIPHQNFI